MLVLQCCVRLSVCTVAKRYVMEQKLLLTAIGSRIWEIDWYQNEWPWPLFWGRLRLCQPLRHIRHWIYRKPLEIEAWFQTTTNRKWPTGKWNGKWSRDRWRHVTLKGQTRNPGTKVTFPLRWLITNSLGTPRPCNDSSMLRRVRNCRRYYY